MSQNTNAVRTWIAACRANEHDDETLESWVTEVTNETAVVIHDDVGEIWVGGSLLTGWQLRNVVAKVDRLGQ